VIDPEGWLHTGDQARIERNHIYITGRLKDILVLSNGEKIRQPTWSWPWRSIPCSSR